MNKAGAEPGPPANSTALETTPVSHSWLYKPLVAEGPRALDEWSPHVLVFSSANWGK